MIYKTKWTRRFTILILTIFVSLIILLPLNSSILMDSPWPAYKGNNSNTGLSPYSTDNITNEIRWTYETSGLITAYPVIGDDGTVYVGSADGRLYAIQENGVLKWSFETDDEIRTSPALSGDGSIYFGSRDGYFYSLDLDGNEKWRYNVGSRIDSSPVLDSQGNIYFGSGDGDFYSLTQTGDMNWKYEVSGRRISQAPAITEDNSIIFGSEDNSLYSLSLNGELEWSFETEGSIRSSPSIDEKGMIYFGSSDYNIYCLYPNGNKKWNYTTEGWISSSPSIGPEGNIYATSTDKSLHAINTEGELLWKFSTSGYLRGSASVGIDGIIYFGDVEGYLYAVNPYGNEKWTMNIDGDLYSSPAIGSNDVMYIGSIDNKLYSIGRLQNVPSPVRNFRTKIEDEGVSLKWDSPDYKGISTDLWYKVYKGTSEDNLTLITQTSELGYNDTSVEKNKTYHYRVTSANEHGESVPSDVQVHVPLEEEELLLDWVDNRMIILGVIVMGIIGLTAIKITLKRKREYLEKNSKEDVDDSRYITCPHCGQSTIVKNRNNGSIECKRCKSRI